MGNFLSRLSRYRWILTMFSSAWTVLSPLRRRIPLSWLRTAYNFMVAAIIATLLLSAFAGKLTISAQQRNEKTQDAVPPSTQLQNLLVNLEKSRHAGDKTIEGATLSGIGDLYVDLHEEQKALTYFNQSLLIMREIGDRTGEAVTLNNIGATYQRLGDKEKARDYFTQALPIEYEVGDRKGEVATLSGIVRTYNGSPETLPLRESKIAIERHAGRLLTGRTVERELEGSQADVFEVNAQAGQYVRVVADQNGIELFLEIIGPDGKLLMHADSVTPQWGQVQAIVVTELSGSYQVRVAPVSPGALLGKYKLSLTDLRSPDKRDAPDAHMLDSLGNIYDNYRDSPKALQYYHQALLFCRALGTADCEGPIFSQMGEACKHLAQYKEAQEYYGQALSVFRATRSHGGEARALNGIGDMYTFLHEGHKALEYHSEALSLCALLPNPQLCQGITLNDMGWAYSGLGNHGKALEYYERALQLHRTAKNSLGEARTLRNIADDYWRSGSYETSLAYDNQSLQLYRHLNNHAQEADTLGEMGGTFASAGQFQKAFEAYHQQLALSEAAKDNIGQVAALNSMGLAYRQLGNTEEALRLHGQALAKVRQLGVHNYEAPLLQNIARIYDANGEGQKALQYYFEALNVESKLGFSGGDSVIISNIGRAYQHLGDRAKALQYYNRALALEDARDSMHHKIYTLSYVGDLYKDMGDRARALREYEAALALAVPLSDPIAEAGVCGRLMTYWRTENKLPLGIFYGKQTINLYQQVRKTIVDLDASVQLAFVTSKASVYRELADLLISDGRLLEAEQVLNLLKETEYSEFVRGETASTGSSRKTVPLTPAEEAVRTEYETVANRITAVGEKWSELDKKTDRTSAEEAERGELAKKLKEANQEMEVYFSRLYAVLGSTQQANRTLEALRDETSDLQSLVDQLGPGVVALYTLVADDHYRVIVVTPSVMVAREVSISKADLRRKVAAFRAAVMNPSIAPRSAAYDLYKVIVAPVKDDLNSANAQTILWSLDDVLRYVPVSALFDGKQYLVDHYRNVVITPASLSRLKDKPDAKHLSGLAMGIAKQYEDDLPSLPAVRQELNGIVTDPQARESRGILPGTIELDDAFTQKSMAEQLKKHYPLVHIASHFIFQPDSEEQSFLLLSGKDSAGKGYHLTLSELRNDPDLRFEGVDLLTLSACETASTGSTADGREVDGFGITAQRKGAKAVLASLWSVNDVSTAQLMRDFYHRWVETPGITKAEALRQAQLTLLHGSERADFPTGEAQGTSSGGTSMGGDSRLQGGDQGRYSHPYYWAPFILIGNWN
jgi:CHAT domain-containing protein/Flp pilus assembly protein TadD